MDYTTFKVYDNASDNSVKYYANEYMNSQKRYDYAMTEFVSDDGTIATCPAMILGSSEVQSKMIFMGHQILSCHVPVVRSFFIL